MCRGIADGKIGAMLLRSTTALAILLLASPLVADSKRVFKCPNRVSVYAVWQKYLQCHDAQKQPVTLTLGRIVGGRQPMYSNTEAMHDFLADLTQAVPRGDAIECHYGVDRSYAADYGTHGHSDSRVYACGGKCPARTSMTFHWPRAASGSDEFKLQGSDARRVQPPLTDTLTSCWYSERENWTGAVYTYRYPKSEKWCVATSQSEVTCRQGQDPNKP